MATQAPVSPSGSAFIAAQRGAAGTAKSRATPVCDCHFHVFNANQGSGGARYVPNYPATLSEWLRMAAANRVSRGVVVQPSFLATDNTVMLAALKREPHALRGVAVVASSATLTELCTLHAAGVRGVRLNLVGSSNDVDTLLHLPSRWWTALIAAKLHLELHTDIGRAPYLLPHVPQGITVVIDHYAKPVEVSGNDPTVIAVRSRNGAGAATYVTLSGAYRQNQANAPRGEDLARLWRSEIGVQRLLWGSDWPCTNFETMAHYPALLSAVSACLPDPDERNAVLASNPNTLYWRD